MKVAINGFGRIGRAAFKIILETPALEPVAVNDLAPPASLAYLLKYDTVYGRYERRVEHDGEHLIVDGQPYRVFAERNPARLPWGRLEVDLVLECTGAFRHKEDLEQHIRAGARFVILSAPARGDEMPTVVHGVNAPDGSTRIISCASCTTNCITPVVEVMGRRIGIKKAAMTTVHAYTSTQGLVDAPRKDVRRGRAGAANLVPTSTGAAIATTKALPQYVGKFDGLAVRAPVPVGSLADLVFLTERATGVPEVNAIFREEAATGRYRGVLGVSEDPLVSSDIIRDPRASVIDLAMTQVIDGDLVKVLAWYDNEWGYAHQMIRQAVHTVLG